MVAQRDRAGEVMEDRTMDRAIAAVIALACTACGASTTEPGGEPGPGMDDMQSARAGSAAVAPSTPEMPGSSPADMQPMTGSPTMPADEQPEASTPANPGAPVLALDECELDTAWEGDQYCILPPPTERGFQLHVGPSDYDNVDAYLVQPGQEINENVAATSGNTSDVYYYWRQYRMRPGSHHMILLRSGRMGSGGGARMGGTQIPAKDSPSGGVIAPENAGVGMPLAALTPLSFSLHYFNFSDAPLLKELWVNVWYRDPAEVTEPAAEVFSGLPINIAPNRHVVLSGSCPVTGSGRLLTLYGHRHANNLRFSAFVERAGMRELVFEDFDWEEPTVLEYSSVITNQPPNAEARVAGGHSGMLEVSAGDSVYFECEIVNMTGTTFRGENEAIDDEMCILVGDSVGAMVAPRCTSQMVDVN
jgi:hypothetical protein